MDDLLQVGPTEQGPLQEFHLTQRIIVNRYPFQQWGQELIGIDVNPRRRLVSGRDQGDDWPANYTNPPRQADRQPFVPPETPSVGPRLVVKNALHPSTVHRPRARAQTAARRSL